MEISPVAAVRIVPTVRPKEADLGLPGIFEIEYSSRTGDETYSPSAAKAASGYEDDECGDPEDEFGFESRVQAVEPGPRRQISYFA